MLDSHGDILPQATRKLSPQNHFCIHALIAAYFNLMSKLTGINAFSQPVDEVRLRFPFCVRVRSSSFRSSVYARVEHLTYYLREHFIRILLRRQKNVYLKNVSSPKKSSATLWMPPVTISLDSIENSAPNQVSCLDAYSNYLRYCSTWSLEICVVRDSEEFEMFDIVTQPRRDDDISRSLTCTNTVCRCGWDRRNLSTDRRRNNLLIHKTNTECAPMNRWEESDVLNREVFDYFRSSSSRWDNLMDGMRVESVGWRSVEACR